MTRAWRRLAVGLVLALALTPALGCREHHAVRLNAGFDRDSGLPDGYQCEDSSGTILLERVKQSRLFSVRVDFMRVSGGVPVCREGDLHTWCEDHLCERITPTPLCFDADYTGGAASLQPALAALARLRDEVVIRDAPDGVVMVRMIGTLQPCAEDVVNPDLVVGCSRSCPIRLDEVSGDVLLTLGGFPRDCERNIKVCASQNFREQN